MIPTQNKNRASWKTFNSPGPKNARQVKSKVETMLILFIDVRRIVHSELVPQGQTLNQKVHLKVLKLHEAQLKKTFVENR